MAQPTNYPDRSDYSRPGNPQTSPTVRYVSSAATGIGSGASTAPWTITQFRTNVAAGYLGYFQGDFGTDGWIFKSGSPSGTSTNWIVCKQWPGGSRCTFGGSQNANDFGLTFYNVAYWAFDGINFDNTGDGAENACLFRGCDNMQYYNAIVTKTPGIKIGDGVDGSTNCWISECTITDCGDAAANSGDGVFLQSGSGTTLSDANTIYNNTFLDCGHMGITTGGFQNSSHLTSYRTRVSFNTIRNHWAGGITNNGRGEENIYEGNLIYESGISDAGAGTENGFLIYGSNNTARYNIIHTCDAQGLQLEASTFAGFGQGCENNSFHNNTVYNCGKEAISMVVVTGLDASRLSGNRIENNILWANHAAGTNDRSAGSYNGDFRFFFVDIFNGTNQWSDDSLNHNSIRNNLVGRTAAGGDGALVIIRAGGSGGDQFYSTTNLDTVATFAEDTSNNIWDTDPLFTNEGSLDFTLQSGSTAINKGAILAGWTQDADYFGTAPDMGYWESGAAGGGGGGGGGSNNTMVETITCSPPDITPSTAAAIDVQ